MKQLLYLTSSQSQFLKLLATEACFHSRGKPVLACTLMPGLYMINQSHDLVNGINRHPFSRSSHGTNFTFIPCLKYHVYAQKINATAYGIYRARIKTIPSPRLKSETKKVLKFGTFHGFYPFM